MYVSWKWKNIRKQGLNIISITKAVPYAMRLDDKDSKDPKEPKGPKVQNCREISWQIGKIGSEIQHLCDDDKSDEATPTKTNKSWA